MAKLTKKEALEMFKEVMQGVWQELRGDDIAKQQAWNDYTDMLCKDGQITHHQYNTWSNPF